MKNLFRTVLLFLLSAFALSSCLNDETDYSPVMRLSYGMVEKESSEVDYSIKLDNGSSLYIMSNLVPNVPVVDQQRVVVNYSIMGSISEPGDDHTDYYIRLNGLDQVLSKSPVLQSFIVSEPDKEEFREDSIGRNPLQVYDIWTGGRYLNVYFAFARKSNSGTKHMLNLVADDLNVKGNEISLTLRHNGYNDVPQEGSTSGFGFSEGVVSFDVMELLPEGIDRIILKVNWEEYVGMNWTGETKSKSHSVAFTPYVINSSTRKPVDENRSGSNFK